MEYGTDGGAGGVDDDEGVSILRHACVRAGEQRPRGGPWPLIPLLGFARMVFSDSETTGHTFFSYIPLFHTCNFIFFYLLTVNLHGNEDSLQDSTVLFVSRTNQFYSGAFWAFELFAHLWLFLIFFFLLSPFLFFSL
ncbi:hypothetical protein CI102_1110 [Trichoderma harzianum]|nr:hypothetical protein CI102_1110 [Trichoderma harzianum]